MFPVKQDVLITRQDEDALFGDISREVIVIEDEKRKSLVANLLEIMVNEELQNPSSNLLLLSELTPNQVQERLSVFQKKLRVIFFPTQAVYEEALHSISPLAEALGAGTYIPADKHSIEKFAGRPLLFLNLDPKSIAITQFFTPQRRELSPGEFEGKRERINPLNGEKYKKALARFLLHELRHVVQDIFNIDDVKRKEKDLASIRTERMIVAIENLIAPCIAASFFFLSQIIQGEQSILSVATGLSLAITIIRSVKKWKNFEGLIRSDFSNYLFSVDEVDANNTQSRVE